MKKAIILLLLLNLVVISIWASRKYNYNRSKMNRIQTLEIKTEEILKQNLQKQSVSEQEADRIMDISRRCSKSEKLDASDLQWFANFCSQRMTDRISNNEVAITLIHPVMGSYKHQAPESRKIISQLCLSMAKSNEGYHYCSFGIGSVALLQIPAAKEYLKEFVDKAKTEEGKNIARQWLKVYEGKSVDSRVKIKN